MEDYKIVWYILAAVIYFLTRKKKKKAPTRPGTENNPSPQEPPKSFEDLLREITGEAREEEPEVIDQPIAESEPVEIEENEEDNRRLEGERRAFADDESRKIYENSIKQAEGFDLEYAPDEHYREPRLFNQAKDEEEEEYSFADEIRDGLDTDEARKAIIYAEIFNRKY